MVVADGVYDEFGLLECTFGVLVNAEANLENGGEHKAGTNENSYIPS
jgi:hypothetical protein